MIALLVILLLCVLASSIFFYRRSRRFEKDIRQLQKERIQMNETFLKVRSERHDFLKHIAAVQFMIETKKTSEAAAYMESLIDGYEETNLSIRGEKGAVAGILHHMFRHAKSRRIEMIYDLEMPISSLPMQDKDIVELIGNVLSNSIEACEKWSRYYQKQPSITLQFSKRSGLYLLTCTNDTLSIPPRVTDQLFTKSGLSTKGGGHKGTGTVLIHRCVKKYNGFLDFIHKNETFCLKIKVPAILTEPQEKRRPTVSKF